MSASIDLPDLLKEQMLSVPGLDWLSFCQAHGQTPPVAVRLNPQKKGSFVPENSPVPWADGGYYLPARPVFTLDPAFHAGAYYVQEASSMFLDHALRHLIGDAAGLRVLDLCAAPGGKSTLVASLLKEKSLLISNDVIRSRATILEENMVRWGYENAWVTSNDPRDFRKLTGFFDIIIVDAPCSGSGMFRKEPASIEGWNEELVKLCAERQQRILADIWPALRQDGLLLYATCSFSPMENEHTLDWLSETYDVSGVSVPLKEEWGVLPVEAECGFPCYRFHPDRVKGEGFFLGIVRKNEPVRTVPYSKGHQPLDARIGQQAAYWLKEGNRVYAADADGGYQAMDAAFVKDWQLLKESLYFRKAGIRLGMPAGKDWVPGHDVAISTAVNPDLPGLELNREQALLFLKREDMGIADMPRGWLMARYHGLGLGWVKSLGSRANNHLPKHWRIRMNINDQD